MAKKKTDSRQTRTERLASARTVPLEEWLDQLRELDAAEPATAAKAAEAAAPPRGACLVKNPRTGQSFCIRTTRDACKALKGSFLGGPCGE